VKSDPVKDKSFADETIDNVRLQKDQVSTHSLSVFQFTKCFGKLSSRFYKWLRDRLHEFSFRGEMKYFCNVTAPISGSLKL